MTYDEFFTDGDKPYAENLNDSLALMDAFNVTVPCEMPGMFNNGEFSSNTNVPRKCGIGIVTLKSVSSGVTIGTTGISGTGDVVFRVYPNFNSFFKWQSIVLTKTGTVSIAFKKTDGSSISATVGNNGVISEASALKELQEIDVVLSLTSATITNILIKFVNNHNSHTRTGALLDADQLTNVNGSVASGNSKAVSGGTVNTALNSLSSTVDNKLALKEAVANKVTTLDNSASHYPSCSAVKAVTDGKANSSHTHNVSDITGLINLVYPIGSVYMSVNNVNPATLFGVGTWEQIEGKFLLASSSNHSLGSTGGSEDAIVVSHNHTQNAHSHAAKGTNQKFLSSSDDIQVNGSKRSYPSTSSSGTYWVHGTNTDGISQYNSTDNTVAANNSAGESGTGKNMPPYITVQVWKRTG